MRSILFSEQVGADCRQKTYQIAENVITSHQGAIVCGVLAPLAFSCLRDLICVRIRTLASGVPPVSVSRYARRWNAIDLSRGYAPAPSEAEKSFGSSEIPSHNRETHQRREEISGRGFRLAVREHSSSKIAWTLSSAERRTSADRAVSGVPRG